MAAGLGFKTFNTGDVLSAADTNGYLMQGVWVFANAAARTAAVASPQEGNMSFLKDTNSTEYYSGSAWVAIASAPAGGGLTLIQEQVASANAAIDFTSISGSYKSLLLVYSGISHSSGSNSFFSIRLNNDSSSIYNNNGFYGTASALTMGIENATSIYVGSGASFGEQVTSASNNAQRVAGYLQIDNYASTTKTKTYYGQFGYQYSTATNRGGVYQGNFDTTTAVTQVNIIRLSGAGTLSNATNTSIRLYGIS